MRAQCIAAVGAALGRQLTPAEADGIEARVRAGMRSAMRQQPQAFQAMSVQSRLLEGARRAAAEIVTEAADAKRITLKQVAVHDSLGGYIAAVEARNGNLFDALERQLVNIADGRSEVQSLESKTGAIFTDYARQLRTTLEASHPRVFGLIQNAEGAALVTRELFGVNTGNPVARAAAKEWAAVIDSMVAQFKDAGGVMHRLADWRFPQHHDQVRVYQAGVDAWTADIMPRLDRSKYVSELGRLMTDAEVEKLVRESWESIAYGGTHDIQPGQAGGASMTAKRHTDHRVLHFKDADAWLEYEAKFGSGDLWNTMTAHVHSLSRDIALMEHFGPNAAHEYAYWRDYAISKAKDMNGQAAADRLDRQFRYLSGQSAGVGDATVAAVMDRTRNLLVAARLGSAVVSSIPDLATMALTARYNRLSVTDVYLNSLKALGPEGRPDLERAGWMIESALSSLRRFQVDALGPTFTARLAEATMRVSGLNEWTQGLRGGFAATQMHALARMTRGVARLADLHPHDAAILASAGVTDADVAVWAAARPFDSRAFGAILTAPDIYAIPDAAIMAIPQPVTAVARSADEIRRQAAQRLIGLTLTESHMAVTEPGARERLAGGAGKARGTWEGELWRSFMQFKSFPWAFFQKHVVQRGLGEHNVAGGKARYLAGLTIASTLLGALAVQVNDMLMGKDPRPMWGDDPKVVMRNWGAAFLKGGALGIYGDFLSSEVSPTMASPLATFLGPVGGLAHDALALTVGNAIQAAGGKDTNAGVEAVRMARGLTPGSTLWYAKAALDHMIWNQLMEAMNPDYLDRVRDRATREYGSTYWYPPESATPERAPRIENIGGR